MLRHSLAVIALCSFFAANNSVASIIFDFEGLCTSGCEGSGFGILELSDSYVPGTETTATADLIQYLAFNNENLVAATPPVELLEFSFDSTGKGELRLVTTLFTGITMENGFWSLENAAGDSRSSGTSERGWVQRNPVPVPVPATFVLLGLGLACLGWKVRIKP